MNDGNNSGLPEIPPGHPIDAGPPPLQTQVKDAKPEDLSRAEGGAQNVGTKEKPRDKRPRQATTAAVVKTPRKRTATAKAAAVIDKSAQTTTASGIPPITDEAISFLGKKDATTADVLKLGSDSLAFVQHHFHFMEKLETDSALSNAYLMANARPVSPAYQKFADALIQHVQQQSDPAMKPAAAKERDATNVSEPAQQEAATALTASYDTKTAAGSAYAPVPIRLGKLQLVFAKVDAIHEDTRRANKVIGTAELLRSEQIDNVPQQVAADLVAGDLGDARAIRDKKVRDLALNAMAESGHAQPRYQAEFELQAPDLVAPAAEVHKAMQADWGLSYSVSNAYAYLSEVYDPERPMLRPEAATMATSIIGEIRGIKHDPYRQDALASSYGIGSMHPLYKEEFARQAPDLVAPARAAAKVERAAETADRKDIAKEAELDAKTVENSIERSPMQLVSVEQNPVQSAPTVARTPAQVAGEASRRKLGKRLLFVIGAAAQKAGIWLSDRTKEVQRQAFAAPISLAKPAAAPAAAAAPAPADAQSTAVPEAVARRFLKVDQEFYFPDKNHAFSDRGNKLATRGAHPEVVRSLVAIARARGWDIITVKGSDEFRRSAWIEAAQNGLKVVGYQPTSIDHAELANRPANNTVEKGGGKEKSAAPAQQQAAAQAVQASSTRSTVAVQAGPDGAPATTAPKPDLELAKKAKAFEDNKPAFVVKKYPDLVGAYGLVEAAKAFAAEKLPEAARGEFVGMAQRHVMQKIISGEFVKGPQIYMGPSKSRKPIDLTTTPVPGAGELGKSPRAKEVARER